MATKDSGSWGIVLAHLLLVFPAGWWFAFVLVRLWGWFVTPFGMPTIGLAHAYGLSMIGWFVLKDLQKNDEDEWKELARATVFALFKPALFLAAGYFVHLIMVVP